MKRLSVVALFVLAGLASAQDQGQLDSIALDHLLDVNYTEYADHIVMLNDVLGYAEGEGHTALSKEEFSQSLRYRGTIPTVFRGIELYRYELYGDIVGGDDIVAVTHDSSWIFLGQNDFFKEPLSARLRETISKMNNILDKCTNSIFGPAELIYICNQVVEFASAGEVLNDWLDVHAQITGGQPEQEYIDEEDQPFVQDSAYVIEHREFVRIQWDKFRKLKEAVSADVKASIQPPYHRGNGTTQRIVIYTMVDADVFRHTFLYENRTLSIRSSDSLGHYNPRHIFK
ncbi:MAG: hypothetical protein IH914_05085 [candidate division Zixibacteria bacterium]|nr:hypothetical protein [candidate division Zixibacteria bacterium]